MLEILKTKDGSCTLKNNVLDETYHSINGALTESLHVFIKNGLMTTAKTRKEIHILEVGLGTGLNALMTLENRPENTSIFYTAIEPFPVHLDMAIEYYKQYDQKPQKLDLLPDIIEHNGETFLNLEDQFSFTRIVKNIQSFTTSDSKQMYQNACIPFNGFDLIYYDAFAPQKQPEMWEFDTLKNVVEQMSENSLFVTYCAQGQFRRHLKSLNLRVESVEGPPGKREMTTAFR